MGGIEESPPLKPPKPTIWANVDTRLAGGIFARLLQSKRIKRWTFYKRDERRIREIKKAIASDL